jgi:hypothetical protein
LAEEKNPDLSTDTKKVDYYNQRVEELRKDRFEVAEIPAPAFDIAKRYAQQGVFQPFGMINFVDEPGKTKDQQFIDRAAERVIFGATHFVKELKNYTPDQLLDKGIDTFGSFERSDSVKALKDSTKMSFVTVKQGLEELNDAIQSGDEDVEDPFKNTSLKKLNPDDIGALLDSTIIKFVKELGLKRDDEARDQLYLENADRALSKITVQATDANVVKEAEYQERLRKAQQEDDLATSLMTSKSGSKVSTDKTKTEEKPAEIKSIETPVVPVTPAPTAAADTQNLKQEIPLAPVVNQEAKPAQISETNLGMEREPEVAAPPVQTTSETGPTVTETAQSPVTEIGKESTAEGEAMNFADNPMLSEFGKALGFSESDMQEVFGGAGASQIAQGLRGELTGKAPESVANLVNESTAEGVKQPETASATKVSEPTKMATPTPAATTPTPPPAVQENYMVSEPEKPAGEATPPPAAPATEEKKEETKAAEESKKEEDKTNAELLKVMKDILRTLQSPLITTDATHKFH